MKKPTTKKNSAPAFGDDPPEDRTPAPAKTPIEQDEIQQQARTLELLDKHRDTGSYIEIHCKPVGEMEYGFLNQIPIEAYSLPKLADKYGGGDYKLVAKTAKHLFITTWFAVVDHTVPPKRPGAAAAPATAQSEMAAIFKQFSDVLAQQRAPAPAESPLKEFMPAIVAAITRPEPKDDKLELFKMMMDMQAKADERTAKLIEAISAKADRGSRLKDVIEEIRAVQELIPEGGDEKKTQLMDVLKAFAPAAAPLVQHFMANGQAPAPAVPQLVAPSAPATTRPPVRPGSPATEAPINAGAHAGTGVTAEPAKPIDVQAETAQPVEDMELKFILDKFRASALEAAAKVDADPVEFADKTVDLVSTWAANKLPDVFAAANDEGWFTKIFHDSAEANAHAKFLTEMRNAILSRAVVYLAELRSKEGQSAEAVAQHILASMAPSYRRYLFDETDEENWAVLFEGVKLTQVFIEQLRVALDKMLDDDTATTPPAQGTPLSRLERTETPAAGEAIKTPPAPPAAKKGARTK